MTALDKYTKGLLAIVLTVIVGNAIYEFIIDEIVYAGSREIQEGLCELNKSSQMLDKLQGKTLTENPEARHACWCASRT